MKAKVTSKLQITVPKAIARRYGVQPGDGIRYEESGEVIRVVPPMSPHPPMGLMSQRDCVSSTPRPHGSRDAKQAGKCAGQALADGPERTSTSMAARALIDTNVLVCRYDDRFPDKQRIAVDVLRNGIETGSARIPHQSILEFVAAKTRGVSENQLLDATDMLREDEELMAKFPIIYPDEAVLRTALRAAACGLSWFDAHIWAYAEVHGMAEQTITSHSVRAC